MTKRTRKSTKPKGNGHATAPEKAGLSARKRIPVARFKPEFVELARKMAALGATDREMADVCGVTDRSFHRWKVQHPSLVKALKLGKAVADEIVERSLFNRAKGYSFDSEKLFVDKDGGEHRMATVEHMAPDVTACIFWLKNRKPEQWRDRIDHTLEVLTTPDQIKQARERRLGLVPAAMLTNRQPLTLDHERQA